MTTRNLPGRLALTDLNGQEEPGASGMQTVRALLELAGTTAGAMSAEGFEERKAELEAVGNDLTRQVFECWKQNPDLSVEIDLDKTTVRIRTGSRPSPATSTSASKTADMDSPTTSPPDPPTFSGSSASSPPSPSSRPTRMAWSSCWMNPA
ncbi:hypothetical protein ACFRDV_23890 [Streptomyces fagopyri]|uniref:hypothetical protein n=1 Tax=Streptomyces fagopyri TaxID=2662397 RepID=UPI0036BDF762